MTLPRYINRRGDLVLPQPYLGKGTHFNGFLFPFDPDIAQVRIIDRYLNQPAGFNRRFVPAIPFASVAFCSIDQLSCTIAPYDSWGYFPENEAAIWMLLRDTVEDKVAWFHPYIYVDNGLAQSMGREVMGFPKQPGRIEMAENRFALETLALKQFRPNEAGGWTKLIEVRRTGERSDVEQLGSFAELAERLFGFLVRHGGLHLVTDLNLIKGLIHGEMNSVFLKQFRDVADGTKACYQAVVQVPSQMTNLHNPCILDSDFQIEIFECASEPIALDFGLTSPILKPIVSFGVDFDFRFDDGVELWRA